MAKQEAPDHSGETITYFRVEPYDQTAMILTSDAVDKDGRLDPVHSQAGDATSPPLSWAAPSGVVSYALVVEDPDAPQDQPVVHWMMWNIPGSLHALPAGIEARAHPSKPDSPGLGGVMQGRNSGGTHGWLGMAPPEGHGPHRYYFQLFALDCRLDFGPDTPLEEFIHALKAGTLAKGQLVGIFETPGLQAGDAATGSYA